VASRPRRIRRLRRCRRVRRRMRTCTPLGSFKPAPTTVGVGQGSTTLILQLHSTSVGVIVLRIQVNRSFGMSTIMQRVQLFAHGKATIAAVSLFESGVSLLPSTRSDKNGSFSWQNLRIGAARER